MLRNPPFCFFASFSIVSLKFFVNNPDYWRDLTIFMISSIFHLKLSVFGFLNLHCFKWVSASAVDTVAGNLNGIKAPLAISLSTIFFNGNAVLVVYQEILLIVLIFWCFILGDELFVKALPKFQTCLSVSNNLCGKLVSSLESPIIFAENFIEVTLVSFFVTDFNLLSCELDNFTFKLLYRIILYWCYIKAK